MLAEGATIDKSEEKRLKEALNDVRNVKGMSKVHDIVHKMFIKGATIEKGEEKQSEPVVEVAKKKKRRGKSKKNKMPTDNSQNGNGKSMENDDFVEASTLDKGKGKENELFIEGSAMDKGTNKEIWSQLANCEVQGAKSNDDKNIMQESLDLIQEAKDVVLGPIFDDEDDEASRILAELDSIGQNAQFHDPLEFEVRKELLTAFRKMHRLMKHAIRPQTAPPLHLDLFCRFVEVPYFFAMMSRMTEELRWNW